MPQWEYRRIDLNDAPRRGDDVDVLNRAGTEGWELVAITGNGVAYVKRPIPEPPKAPGRRKAAAAPAAEE
jgi:hypothetical protein